MAIVIVLMCLGLLAIKNLRVNPLPDVQQPVLVVQIPYPGASPETVEREIINRVEKALQSIPQVYEIRSTANEGRAQIVMIFNFRKNMVEAADEIRNAIGTVRYKLPIEMREPVLFRDDPADEPVMQLSLSSQTQTLAEISRLAEDDLADRFRAINGVATVNVNGSLRRELSVLLRAQKLREYNVSVAEVVARCGGRTPPRRWGRSRARWTNRASASSGRIESPQEFENIVLRRNGDEVVRLGQVATVRGRIWRTDRIQPAQRPPQREHFRHPLTRCQHRVRGGGSAQGGQGDHSDLPKGTTLEVVQDGGEEANLYLMNVIEALILGASLTILVVYAFLNSWRSTLITALSLPTSAITAFIAVWLAGFTLNFMTLLGLSLAIGVLIDDAIVVRENIVRHLERGEDRVTAARNGTAEIGLAVAATTFSIMAVFVPVAFMGGVAGEWFRPFAVTVDDLGDGEPVHLLHARSDAVGLLGRSSRTREARTPRSRPGAEAFQHLVRRTGRALWAAHRLGPASPQMDGRDRGR